MLSRTADHLYWMARYMERAKNIARLLDTTARMGLTAIDAEKGQQHWGSVLATTGLFPEYFKRHPMLEGRNVVRFMALDADNPGGIHFCLCAARENAHAVRGTLTSEMWEVINTTWLELMQQSPRRIKTDDASDFFDWVKNRALLLNGVTEATLLQDEAWRFVRLGESVERADNTSRLVDVKYHIMLPSVEEVGGAADYYQWGSLLRSLSAFENYRKVYKDAITPLRVAELLILNADLPRSLHSCMNVAVTMLEAISAGAPHECVRMAGELHARLHYARIQHVFDFGLHEWLSDFIGRLTALTAQISRDFHLQATN